MKSYNSVSQQEDALPEIDIIRSRLFSIKFGAKGKDVLPSDYVDRIVSLHTLRDEIYQRSSMLNKRIKTKKQVKLLSILWIAIILAWARSEGKIHQNIFLKLIDQLIEQTRKLS
ncbi:MAG: hypothetical protein ACTSVM_05460 [Candidatus Ranarchaeia archaeon]